MVWQLTFAIILLIVDRAAKVLALKQLFVQSWFTLFLNEGIVFSFMPGTWPLLIASLVLLLLVFLALTRYKLYTPPARLALLLIAAGSSSNIYDRLIHGGVIDYISLGSRSVFNLADVYIMAGVLLLLTALFLLNRLLTKQQS